jgi:TFIIH basal transcription factor complex TTD-A subunit
MMPVAYVVPGVLIECDPSIHSIISKFDAENHDYIIEDLDETHVVVKENMLPLLKKKLDDVSCINQPEFPNTILTVAQFLSATREPVQQESSSEGD